MTLRDADFLWFFMIAPPVSATVIIVFDTIVSL